MTDKAPRPRLRSPQTPHLVDKHGYGVISRQISDMVRQHHLDVYKYIEHLELEVDRLEDELVEAKRGKA